jgi:hypothetical protein
MSNITPSWDGKKSWKCLFFGHKYVHRVFKHKYIEGLESEAYICDRCGRIG